ncbi:hypothetical protein BP5796_10078 [Coleophoma crateriformis]|uniref:Histone acetyltransferase type B catalytic subunit n=1 Tax=Coleophoma crateriformis TaxID=565419 RepID=A0A3D8QU62_9HELO|nr:hypothetical protein BP5796_10078 [Coleophoma crateriformis]
MAAVDVADWSADSNDAVHISLIKPVEGGVKPLHTFHPKMSYSIFGDEESIFGYQGLKINLKYNASDMRPGLQITYSKKFKTVGETSPTDLKAILENYLPKTAFGKTKDYETSITQIAPDWKPPGELYRTSESGGQTFEVWKGCLADLAVQQLVKRIQILVPMFIEGGTFIELKDPEWSLERWTVFFLYNKRSAEAAPGVSPYVFMGYATVYRYFYYQPLTPPTSPSNSSKKAPIERPATLDFQLPISGVSFSDLPCRSRISQFLILPPFQGGGHGARFYNTIFDFYLAEPQTLEITVEDPNEAFDDLRDLNDLARLRTDPEFTNLRMNTNVTVRSKGPAPKDIVDPEQVDKLRKKFKIAPRQFSRLVEMYLLSLIPKAVRQSLLVEQPKSKVPDLPAREHEYHLWKLLAKQRLTRHNKDALAQLDRAERIDKLDQALGGVEADYARLLRSLDEKNDGKGVGSVNRAASGTKRSSPDDDNDGDEDEGEPSTKKLKFA